MHKSIKAAAVAMVAAALAACSSHGGGNSAIPMPNGGTAGQSVAQHGLTMSDAGIDLSKVHVMPTYHFAVAPNGNPADNLVYGGGAVEFHSHIYVVYWGFGLTGHDPSGEKAYLTGLLTNLGGSPWLNTDHQYYQIVGGVKQFIQNTTGQLKGTWVDDGTTVPASPTDAQIQAEAKKLMSHFVFDKDASYVVATPHNHNTAGFGTQFCAYHGATTSSKGVIAYTNLPYITDAGQNCGENIVNPGKAGLLDGASIVEGHELAESQTDPQPFGGWVGPLSEIGDACAWQGLADVTFGGKSYAMQPLWSNKVAGCTLHTP